MENLKSIAIPPEIAALLPHLVGAPSKLHPNDKREFVITAIHSFKTDKGAEVRIFEFTAKETGKEWERTSMDVHVKLEETGKISMSYTPPMPRGQCSISLPITLEEFIKSL